MSINDNELDLYNEVLYTLEDLYKFKQPFQNIQKNLKDYATKLFDYVNPKYKIIFVNSSSEANDLALRISLRYRNCINDKKFISLKNSFHGTTYLCDRVSYFSKNNDEKEETIFIEPNNVQELDKLFEKKQTSISSIIVETIQGEAGNLPLSEEFVKNFSTMQIETKS